MSDKTPSPIQDVTVLTNPAAGHGLAKVYTRRAVERLISRGLRVTVVQGESAMESTALAREAVEAGADAIVAAGGDGLVSLVLNVIARTDTPLAILPSGTGNDHARLFGVPREDPVAAADVIVDGRIRSIDLGRVGQTWFGTVLASGFDSLVTDRANRMRWPRGRMRYNLAMLAELANLAPLPFRIELDDRVLEIDAALVAVGNGSSYGGGMRICPDASVDDGLLDVTVVAAGGRMRLVRLFPTVYKGTHVHLPEVRTFRSRTVRLSNPTLIGPPITAYADGERLAPLPVTIESVPKAARVIAAAEK